MSPPRLETFRTDNDTATRIGFHVGPAHYLAITVFDTSDAKTVADQFRALVESMDPQGAKEWPTGKWKSRRPFGL